MTCSIRRSFAPFAFVACSLLCAEAHAQISPLLRLQSVTLSNGGPAELSFADTGSGATNYAVEFSPTLGAAATWTDLAGAVVTDLGGGHYEIAVTHAPAGTGFLRVRGLGGTISLVTASFATTDFQITEGGMVRPTITFSGPFYGTLQYTIGGTAGTGDYANLSGQIFVNGSSTATIPVTLTDNTQISQLKYLTLRLDAGPGYNVGDAGAETTITIDENDANWRGTFTTGNATLGFTLTIRQSGGFSQATLEGDGSGFFPTNEIPTAINLTPDAFSALATGIPLAANATLLNTPTSLSLSLSAMNGLNNQSVSATQIQGSATLIAQYAGQPQLNTTNFGTFLLLKPPAAPSTNQVQLTAAP